MKTPIRIVLCFAAIYLFAFDTYCDAAYQSELNKFDAIANKLESIDKRLDKIIKTQQFRTAPDGILGELNSINNKLVSIENKMLKVVNSLPPEPTSVDDELLAAAESIGQLSVPIADKARVGLVTLIDYVEITESLDILSGLASNISRTAHTYMDSFWGKTVRTIPIRFIQGINCYPGTCDPPLDYISLLKAVGAANRTFSESGIHFVIDSVEQYQMYNFANKGLLVEHEIDWYTAKEELAQVFSITEPSSIPYDRTATEWISYMSTVFSDPTELVVWVFDPSSLVSRQIEGHSVSAYPNTGRTLIISSQNISNPNRPNRPNDPQPVFSPYNLAHELGHYFGLTHLWDSPSGKHPITKEPLGWHDMWDLITCYDSNYHQISFSSAEDVLNSGCDVFFPIHDPDASNCKIDNRSGDSGSDSEMVCTGYFAGVPETFRSGDPMLQGLSFDLGAVEDPPSDFDDNTYSFAWALNAMGYWSYFNAHLWTPGLFSASQSFLVWGHAHNSVLIDGGHFYSPFTNIPSGRDTLGTGW